MLISPSDEDQARLLRNCTLDEDRGLRSFLVSPGKLSITSLKAPFNARVGYLDPVYLHPRDGRIAISSDARRDATLAA